MYTYIYIYINICETYASNKCFQEQLVLPRGCNYFGATMALVQGSVSADVHSMQFSFQENQKKGIVVKK